MDIEAEEDRRYLHTALVGRVCAIDVLNRTVDVEVLTQRAYMGTDTRVSRPIEVLNDVPLALPCTAAGGLHLKMNTGDTVLVVFNMHYLGDVIAARGECGVIEPTIIEDHGLGSGLAIPFSLQGAHAQSTNADAELRGADVRLGNPSTAATVAFQDSVQSAVNDLAAKMNSLASAAGVTLPYAPGGLAPVPTITGTTNTRAS